MARTSKGARLTEDHRQQQARLVAAVVKSVQRVLAERFDLARIDETAYAVAAAVSPLVMAARRESHAMSLTYLREFQQVESSTPSDEPVDFEDTYSEDQTLLELVRTIIGTAKAMSKKGKSYNENRAVTEAAVVRKVTKVVADGGRAVIENDVRSGGKGRGPIGYARVADADPCAFCAMLASRGVYYLGQELTGDDAGTGLYSSDSFAASNSRFVGDGEFKVHDGCQCTLEPVYYDGTGTVKLPGNGNELAEQWAQVAAGRGADSYAVWRRWITSKTLPEDYEGPLEEQGVKRVAPETARREAARATRNRASLELADKRVTLSSDVLEQHMATYKSRLSGIEGEIADLKRAGQTNDDASVAALWEEHRRLTRQIEVYALYLDRLDQ